MVGSLFAAEPLAAPARIEQAIGIEGGAHRARQLFQRFFLGREHAQCRPPCRGRPQQHMRLRQPRLPQQPRRRLHRQLKTINHCPIPLHRNFLQPHYA